MHSNYIYYFQVYLLELVYVSSFQVYHFMIFLQFSQMSIFTIFIPIRIFHYNLIDSDKIINFSLEINFYLLNLKFIFFNCLFLFTIYFIELTIFKIYFNFSFIMTKLGFIIIY